MKNNENQRNNTSRFFVRFSGLLGILLICVLNGQVISKWDTDTTNIVTLGSWYGINDTIIIYQNFTVINLLALYEQYEIECYNDSSQTIKHIGDYRRCQFFSTGWQTANCNNPSHYDQKIWIHKQPSFQGFMGWLKKFQK